MNVGQENVADGMCDAHLVLHMQRKLEIIAPITSVHTVVRDHRVCKENVQSLKILVNAIQHDDVGRDHQKVARQFRIRLIQFVVKTPRQHQAHHFGFARPSRHLHHETPPVLVEHAGGYRAGMIEAHHVVFVFYAHHVIQVDDGFQRLALREVILELGHWLPSPACGRGAGGEGLQVRRIKPPVKQAAARFRGFGIVSFTPCLHLFAQFGHQWRHQFFKAGFP